MIGYKFLIVDTYYQIFLSWLYRKFPELADKDYYSQKEFIMGFCFGTADFYSKNLKKLGCEAEEIIPNNEILQKQWALENGLKLEKSYLSKIVGKIQKIKYFFPNINLSLAILKEQIKKFKPDILYIQDLSFCPPEFLKSMKKYVKLIVGQIACPLPHFNYIKSYDIIITSFPHFVDKLRSMGIKSEYLKIGFEPTVLEKIGKAEKRYNCTFIGGISKAHKKRLMFLEEVAKKLDVDFFGYGTEILDRNSPIITKHHGEVWGLDMYKVLCESKITLNHHIDVAENYANNMRLYEATGCGALLITDFKKNLPEIFVPGKEVIAYESPQDAIYKIKYYLEHEKEGKEIANAGQKRTLTEHTYYNRMSELLEIIKRYI